MTQAPPLISIVVNLYNGERYIGECLDSILALEGGYPLQVIVLDDASTDGGGAVVTRYDDPRIEYVRMPQNVGAAAAITHAFGLARGEFLARIDYDDRYRPNFLTASAPALQACPDAAFVCAAVQMIDPEGRPTAVAGPADYAERPGCEDRFLSLLRRHFVTAPTILARTSHWLRAMPVPERMDFCDWYMNLVMAETAPVVVLDEVTADYRIHPANMHSTIVRSGRGEAITFQVLRRFLFGSPRRKEMSRHANSILGWHYADWGDKYYGAEMSADALRCYGAALKHDSTLAWRSSLLRRAAGLLVGRQRYDALKSAVVGANR